MNTELQTFIHELEKLTRETGASEIRAEEVARRFPGQSLSNHQLLLICQYLISTGIDVTDYEALKKRAEEVYDGQEPAGEDAAWVEEDWMAPWLEMMEEAALPEDVQESILLQRAAGGDSRAEESLIRMYMKMLLSLCRSMSISDEKMRGDLVSEGLLSLIEAIRDYPNHTDLPFSEHASRRIRTSLHSYIEENDAFHRMLAELTDKLSQARAAHQSLSEELDREPTEEEIAARIGISADRLLGIRGNLPEGTPLYSGFLEEDTGEDPSTGEDMPREYLLSEQILKSISGLPVLDQECFIRHFGLDGKTPVRTGDLALQYNITENHVRQCIEHALEQMKDSGLDTSFFTI